MNITGNSFSGLSENVVEAIGDCRRILVSSNLVSDITGEVQIRILALKLLTPITLPCAEQHRAVRATYSLVSFT